MSYLFSGKHHNSEQSTVSMIARDPNAATNGLICYRTGRKISNRTTDTANYGKLNEAPLMRFVELKCLLEFTTRFTKYTFLRTESSG